MIETVEDEIATQIYSKGDKILVRKKRELVMCMNCTNMIPSNKVICGECAGRDGFREEAM